MILPRLKFSRFCSVLISSKGLPRPGTEDLIPFLCECRRDHDTIYPLDSFPASALDRLRAMTAQALAYTRKVVVAFKRPPTHERLHEMEQDIVDLTEFRELLGKTGAATPEGSND